MINKDIPANKKTINKLKAFLILLFGLVITVIAGFYVKHDIEIEENQKFKLICVDIKEKVNSRLKAHAQLLRSCAAFFAASDSVTRNDWEIFNDSTKIRKNLPGIQGVGYSIIVPKDQLYNHIQSIRNEGFPDYNIIPEGKREIYTSIIFLEPFSGRNLRAFGFDMLSEPTRRKAMELSRDSDFAMLTGKVILIQETAKDIQAGTLMYVPVYKKGMPVNSIEQRRSAIKGWVYSPYRMNDLMNEILGNRNYPDKYRVHLQIYDENTISVEALLYDSQANEKFENIKKANLQFKIPIEFNTKKWILQFSQYNDQLSIFHYNVLIVLISGISISFLLFALSLALINTRYREQQISLLNIQLEKLNNDKDRFISILAHDLKSPFTSILGFLGLLKYNIHKYSIEKIETQVHIIDDSANRIFNLLDELLMWTRTQSGKMPYTPTNICLSNICLETLENIKVSAQAKSITVNCISNKEIMVFADINMIKTILRNLISNAIKFTNNGGIIDISAIQNEFEITISVSDNGVGIEPTKLANIFNISQIKSTSGTANEKGTGLGLLLCKEFVEKHKGKIWAESEVGKGSIFKFTLPLHKIKQGTAGQNQWDKE